MKSSLLKASSKRRALVEESTKPRPKLKTKLGAKPPAVETKAKDWTQDARVKDFERMSASLSANGGVRGATQKLHDIQMKRIAMLGKLTYATLHDGHLEPIGNAQIKDVRHRAAVTKMIMQLKDEIAVATDGLSLLRRHLKSTYAAELKAAYGALTNVDAAIESHFNAVVTSIKASDRFLDIANDLIRDIDQAAFTYQRLLTTAGLVLGPRAQLRNN